MEVVIYVVLSGIHPTHRQDILDDVLLLRDLVGQLSLAVM